MKDEEIEVIIKPIFTKMFNSNFSACEYGIECYKKGMEYQGIKELAIENDNLIKQVRELKRENEQLKTDYEVLSCSVGDFGKLQDKFEEEQRKNNGLSDKLTKAIELLKWALHSDPEHDNLVDFDTKWKEAEQFIKENENV